MTRSHFGIATLLVVLAGLWGCGQGPSRTVLAERVKSLESKIVRLEDDYHLATVQRDQFRQQLSKAEALIQDLQVVVKERDELKLQVKNRVSERDQVAAQFEQFRKSLRDLATQAEAASIKFQDTNTAVSAALGK